MLNKKYVIANIQIPMEISESGNYESLMDYVSVDFTQCSKLPEKSINLNNTINDNYKNMLAGLFPTKIVSEPSIIQTPVVNQSIDQSIDQSISQSIVQKPDVNQSIEKFVGDLPFTLFVNPTEILHKKRGKNTSFKNPNLFAHNRHSFSAKNRSSIESDIVRPIL